MSSSVEPGLALRLFEELLRPFLDASLLDDQPEGFPASLSST
jgi:hypothetical protein